MWKRSAYERLRDGSPAFSGILYFVWSQFDTVVHDGRSGPAQAEVVSGNYFDVLGLSPYAGRLRFADQELGNLSPMRGLMWFWRRRSAAACCCSLLARS